jgi:hypothetical protein
VELVERRGQRQGPHNALQRGKAFDIPANRIVLGGRRGCHSLVRGRGLKRAALARR